MDLFSYYVILYFIFNIWYVMHAVCNLHACAYLVYRSASWPLRVCKRLCSFFFTCARVVICILMKGMHVDILIVIVVGNIFVQSSVHFLLSCTHMFAWIHCRHSMCACEHVSTFLRSDECVCDAFMTAWYSFVNASAQHLDRVDRYACMRKCVSTDLDSVR